MINTTWVSPTWNMDKDISKEIEESENMLRQQHLRLQNMQFEEHNERLYKYFENKYKENK
jgi:hypothetical protein